MRRIRRGARTEKGATAIVTALVAIVLFAAAALGVDIANLTMERQELHDAVDAAAHAAAMDLPNTTAATTANTFAKANDPDANPTTVLYCVVAANASNLPTQTQVPSTCDPDGTGGFVGGGWKCQGPICAKPCTTSPNAKCNTVRVEASKDVPYYFAPIIGYEKGSTGVVVSAACKGSCGTEAPNPLDIVIMADRTASMKAPDRAQMKQAILTSLTTMEPTMHHVAFGALAKSRTSGWTHKSEFTATSPPAVPTYENCNVYPRRSKARADCQARNDTRRRNYDAALAAYEANNAAFAKRVGWDGTGDLNGDGYCRVEAVRTNGRRAEDTRNEGTWIPVDYSNNYIDAAKNLRNSSELVDAVNCLPESTSGEYGTNLGGSLKAAVRKAIAGSTIPGANTRPGAVRKVVIFETDGMPDEVGSASGSTSVDNAEEVWSGEQTYYGQNGCNRFLEVANSAKAKGILLITIGFGDAATARCKKSEGTWGTSSRVRDVLAAAASNAPDGTASEAGNCGTESGIDTENEDGDYFFCAAQGDELADVFTTAFAQISSGVRLIRLP